MFGFGNSGPSTPKGDIFDVEEIRQLVLDFPPLEQVSSGDTLIPLASDSGFTTRAAISTAYAKLILGRYGKIPISALEKQLDVEHDTLLSIIRSRKDFMLSRCKEEVITRCDQERILEEVYAKAKLNFVCASDLAEEHDVDAQCISKLVTLSEETCSETPLQLLDAPGQSRARSLDLGLSYVHTLSVLLALKNDTVDRITNAHTAARVATWSKGDMLGLDIPTFARLAHKFIQDFNGSAELSGFFETGKDEVRFVTKTYLLRKAKRTLKEVAMGDEAFCDLAKLVRAYPTFLQDIDAARRLAVSECLHKDGSKYKWHFISHYAIGDVGLNNTAKRCLEILGPQRYLNAKPFVQAFPSEIQREVLVLLQERTVEFWRTFGGEMAAVLGLEEWLVFKRLTNDLDSAAKRLGRTCADDAWQRNVEQASLAQESEQSLFLQRLQEESDLPIELLQRLWADERVKIKEVAEGNFKERVAELEAENKGQLESLWKSRVYIPARLHTKAIDSLETGPLKDQLRDLLSVHLAQDLVPNTLKRIRSKGFARDQSIRKQLEKLDAAVTAEKKGNSFTKSLEKFHEKMGFAILGGEEIAQARKQQLTDMVKAMETDTDGPRLFLVAVIVLFACNGGSGIVYATGKFAPRLLKVLKLNLDEERYKNLERLKDAVKAGNVSNEDRQEMRNITATALQEDAGAVGEVI